MEWLSPQEMVEEAFEFYPGLVAKEYGFLPIGKCMAGSGDPYFLKELKVYRIRHDSIGDDQSLEQNGIEEICSLEYLFKNGIKPETTE